MDLLFFLYNRDMIYIVCALYAESKSLIQKFHLKRKETVKGVEVFENEDTSIANLKEMLSNVIDVIKLMNMIDRCLEVIDVFRYIMPICVLFDHVILTDDVCNLIIKKHGKDYKFHLDNFKKLMNLKSLLYKHIDTV